MYYVDLLDKNERLTTLHSRQPFLFHCPVRPVYILTGTSPIAIDSVLTLLQAEGYIS